MEHKKSVITALFADITGFTNFSNTNSLETVQKMLSELYSIAEMLAPKHNGRFTEITGDEISMHFENPSDAIDVAIELRNNFEPLAKKYTLNIRMGIYTGEGITWYPKVNNIYFPYVTGMLQILANTIEASVDIGKIGISKVTLDMIKDHKFKEYEIKETIRKGLTEKVEYIEI